jgi:hypothetical protein
MGKRMILGIHFLLKTQLLELVKKPLLEKFTLIISLIEKNKLTSQRGNLYASNRTKIF